MNCLIAYYSRTGNTHQVAQSIANRLEDPEVERIRSKKKRSYYQWLFLSLVPGFEVNIDDISYDPRDYDTVFLGVPKWSLSCPPANTYIHHANFANTKVAPFVTYGGFDERRFASSLVARLRAENAIVPGYLLVQRDQIGGKKFDRNIDKFLNIIL